MLIRLTVLAVLLSASLFAVARAVEAKAIPAPVAAPATYQVDGVHSSVIFRIKHANVAYFYGRFNDVSGTINWDADKPTASSFDIQIATGSVDTANDRRDAHLRSDDFFSAEEHPSIRFVTTKIERSGDKLQATGELTLRGVTKPVTVDLEHTGTNTRRGAELMGLHAKFTIKRTDFEMPYGVEAGALGDEVLLLIGIEGVRRLEPTASE